MSVGDGPSVVPPGWYPDPADDARLRRWDGDDWTQDVILNPDGEPAEPAEPAAPPAPAAPTPARPEPAAPPSTPPTVSAATEPPAGQPVPASPAPSTPPPMQPTTPRPSPSVNQHPNPSSGPVSLPEWANLPGLTLPPDLRSIPGLEDDSVLGAPTFAEPPLPEPAIAPPKFTESAQRGLPTLPVFEPPFIPQRPDVQDAGAGRVKTAEPKSKQDAAPHADPYAPPPLGAQYDVPPPPGMAHVPAAGLVLPPSALVAPLPPAPGWSALPPVGSVPISAAPLATVDFGSLPRTSPAEHEPLLAIGPVTVSAWLIGLLPLMQIALIYLAFGVLHYTLAPGMQWGILLAPAAFSLLFANADRTKLASLDADSPNIPFAFVAPLYLIVRCSTTGRSSVGPLVLWFVLQAGAVAVVLYLLPALLKVPIPPLG